MRVRRSVVMNVWTRKEIDSKHGRDVLFVGNFSLKTGPPGKPSG